MNQTQKEIRRCVQGTRTFLYLYKILRLLKL